MSTDPSSETASSTECPCENESTDRLSTDPQPERIITLVHGTFAKHAPWTREGPLWDQLSDTAKLHGTTLFKRFCWSGSNSHSDRLTAGEALQKELIEVAEKFSNVRNYIIGHGHGGNVMLYATKEKEVSENITGMITMATPFIAVRRRKLPKLVLLAGLAIAIAGAFEAYLFFTTAGETASEPSLLVAILVLVWLSGTLLSTLLYRPYGKAFGLGKLFTLLRRGKNSEAIINEELQRLKLTPDDEKVMQKRYDKILVVRPIGDEASMSLIVAQFLSWFENRILTFMSSKVIGFFSGIGLFSWTWKILLLLTLPIVVALFVLPGTIEHLLPKVPEDFFVKWADNLISYTAVLIIWGGSAMILLVGFLSLIAMIGLLLAGLAFGLDAMFWNHFVSTTAECSPPGAARVYLQSPTPDDAGHVAAGLAHSGIYRDSKVINEIVEWIQLRESVQSDPG
jgi:hypothetical protein